MSDKHWSLQDYAKKVKSAEIIKHKPSTLPKSYSEITEQIIKSPKSVTTPDRKIIGSTPGRTVCVRGSPKSVRYRSKRKIEFN